MLCQLVSSCQGTICVSQRLRTGVNMHSNVDYHDADYRSVSFHVRMLILQAPQSEWARDGHFTITPRPPSQLLERCACSHATRAAYQISQILVSFYQYFPVAMILFRARVQVMIKRR